MYNKCLKDIVGKEKYITSSIISDKLKVNMSLAREVLKELNQQQQIIPFNEFHSKYCIYIKGPNYHAEDKKDSKPIEKKEKKQKVKK